MVIASGLEEPHLVEDWEDELEGFEEWEEDDFEEIEIIDAPSRKSKPAVSKKEKGIWQRFTDWLEKEDDDLADLYAEKPKKAKPKVFIRETRVKKSEKGAWDRFMEWIDEEEPAKKPSIYTPAKAKPVEKPKKKGKGAWQRFSDWLDEDDEPVKVKKPARAISIKKPVKKTQKDRPKKKGKSGWDRFMDWLEEE